MPHQSHSQLQHPLLPPPTIRSTSPPPHHPTVSHRPPSSLPPTSLRYSSSSTNRRPITGHPEAASKRIMAHSKSFPDFSLAGGPELAKLAFRALYQRDVRPDVAGDMTVRDEYAGWLVEARPVPMIDYYGVTFDHLVPADEIDPEVLQINIFEVEDGGGAYANKYNPFDNDPTEYIGLKVLAVPRCCQKRKGTTDRRRVNDEVNIRDSRVVNMSYK
ncbi:hypothetical protein V492_06016 [Pseudogymnoascus sp. VKM F-4246]|nr:hypothetical protein V492_06016 [Pseudogymnoascus sp. VKM F-4246]